ncbi:MAG: hypothetical protein ACXWDM_03545 [Nocardioides sp.]
MSRDDSEFAAYLAARWPALVRTLVFLGHPEPDAHAVALDALVRIYPDWPRLRREEDVEVAVYREVLHARDRHLRRIHRRGDPPAAPAPRDVPPAMAEQAERRDQVEAALARMSPGDRMVVVLEYVAELSEDQVADVLDTHVGSRPQLADADVRLAVEVVPVDPLLARDVAERSRARRRRTWTRTLGAVAVVVALVAAAGWVVDRRNSVGQVSAADNPLPVAWYADGVLHLDAVTVEVRPVDQLVSVADGVVLSDVRGDVTMVDSSGALEKIGDTVPGTALVVEPDNGWVAWADPGDGDPEVVVHDTRVGEEVGRRSLSVPGEGGGQPVGDSGPIAIDDERVYYTTRGSDFVWEPLPDEAFAIAGSLADAAGGARLSNAPEGYLVQGQPFLSGTIVSGTDGRLTSDGRFAFVVAAEEVAVYDVDTGRQVERMYSPSDRAVSWTYSDGTFYFAVLHKLQDKTYQDMLQMPSEGNYRIFECVPDRADACIELVEVPEDSSDAPVLAR